MKPIIIPIAPWLEKAWQKRIYRVTRIADRDIWAGEDAPIAYGLEATGESSHPQEFFDQPLQSHKIAPVAAAELGSLAPGALIAAELEKAINQESSRLPLLPGMS